MDGIRGLGDQLEGQRDHRDARYPAQHRKCQDGCLKKQANSRLGLASNPIVEFSSGLATNSIFFVFFW